MLSHDFGQRACDVAFDHALDVMKGCVRFPIRVLSIRIFGKMLTRIPTADRQVQTTDKCDRVIDDDDLLVLCRTEGQARIHAKPDSAGTARRKPFSRISLPFGGIQRPWKIPGQDVDAELGTDPH
jgi:hypothetical protein